MNISLANLVKQYYRNNTQLTYDTQSDKIFESTVNLLTDLDDDLADINTTITRKNMNSNIKKQTIVSMFKSIIYKFDDITDIDEHDNTNIEYIKSIINNPDNFYEYAGCILAYDKTQLKRLIHIGCKILGHGGNFNWIDTSKITDMSELFYDNKKFNGHIELWDVSRVTNMTHMFCRAPYFNQPIGDWDVSNVTDMSHMFYLAKSFNQPIGDWDVSNVTNMYGMFCEATTFNQPIGDWDVSRVTNMGYMFYNAFNFNQPIGDWDVSNVTTMDSMFEGARSFSQPIGDWDVSNVTNMRCMFCDANSFNQDVSKWELTSGCEILHMFTYCPILNEYKPKRI